MKQRRAVVLLSGGLDSATVLAMAAAEAARDSAELYTMTFDYGQRHRAELDAARAISARCPCVREHRVGRVDLAAFGGSALTDHAIEVPKGRTGREMAAEGIPPTYVPARNTIFLSYALAWADVLGAEEIHIGVNALDYSGYPDCRPEYCEAFERMANLAIRGSVRICRPLVAMTKAEIIRAGAELGVDYGATVSCYEADGGGGACARCDACWLRREGFRQAGIKDPTRYA